MNESHEKKPTHQTAKDVGTGTHLENSAEDQLETAEFSADQTGNLIPPTVKLSNRPRAATPASFTLKSGSAEMPDLPGYSITGVLGRGGMGVVYQARQKGLDRLVAIKMLLAGTHAGEEYFARFQTEAQAVASLQHPNIVQIYEVGEQGGLPFFSLEFVPGGSLAQKIAGKPQPAEDSARLVETAARAIHCAHQLGIVHRDLKPANILLAFSDHSSATSLDPAKQKLLAEGPLRNAIPKISDFGLAKRLEMDSRQTRSGTIMGSPSYMAPEQARGDVRDVGPLADVYALGTVLYELLTGRPPFLAANAIDIVSQVVNNEPVAPTRLEPKVPNDLETICLKCLQKDSRKRYSSAEALANDLRHFLNGEPIVARPVSTYERFWRWCVRNPWLAGSSGLAALLFVFALAVSVWAAVTFAAQNTVIKKEKESAVEAQGIAQREAENAKTQRGIAEANAQAANEARELADENARAADENAKTASTQATANLLTIQLVIENMNQQLSEVPGTQKVRERLLNLAMDRINKVADAVDKSTSKEATTLASWRSLGSIYAQVGATDKAFEYLTKACDLARERVVVKNGSDASRINLGRILQDLGQLSQEYRRDMQLALEYYQESASIRQEILDQPYAGDGEPAKPLLVKMDLAETQARVAATILRLGDPAQALTHFQRALDLRRELVGAAPKNLELRQDLARSLLSIGETKMRLGDSAAAYKFYGDGLAERERLLNECPENLKLRFKHEVGRTHGNFGEVCLYSGDVPGAADHYQQCLTIMQELADSDPGTIGYQRDLGLAHYRLGSYSLRNKDPDKARFHFNLSRAIRESMTAKDPLNDRRQMELMLVLPHCDEHEPAARLADRYAAGESADNELLVDVSRCYAQCSEAARNQSELSGEYVKKATDTLSRAIDRGYRDIVHLKSEPDFDSIRDNDAFRSLLHKLQRDLVQP
jgi:eukaryotic-like serine/threonine-protein kinase